MGELRACRDLGLMAGDGGGQGVADEGGVITGLVGPLARVIAESNLASKSASSIIRSSTELGTTSGSVNRNVCEV